DGENVEDWRKEFYLEQHFDLTTTNSPHRIPPVEGVLGERYKYMNYFKHGGAEELYDYLEDPYEKENLVNDPAYQQVLEMMKEKYEKMKMELQ
ncbi:MAG: sulfatase/phosphatase domain-containing protein, partial [Prolixibacteraceae bacterium]